MKSHYILAIDGPAGSGKSTVAKEVARRLGFLYVDTGAMYRALTLNAIKKKLDFDDEDSLIALAGSTDIELRMGRDFRLSVILEGVDVSDEIRKSYVTKNVRHVARVPRVREQMVRLQRRAASSGKGAVLEGRDIGTVVFPDADRKIYLDADIGERVKRRFKELKGKGHDVSLDEVERDVVSRDDSDKTRDAGPLKKADDAIVIDTTDMTIDEVADSVVRQIKTVQR